MEALYSDKFLLDRFDVIRSKKQKASFFLPNIIPNRSIKKTYIQDFPKFCDSVKRDLHEIKLFIELETNYRSSLSSNNDLIIDICNSHIDKQIKDILNKYIKTKVICQEPNCNSGNTELIKENRITFIYCNSCHSKKSLN